MNAVLQLRIPVPVPEYVVSIEDTTSGEVYSVSCPADESCIGPLVLDYCTRHCLPVSAVRVAVKRG